jgi:hypothetical protein
VILYYFVLLKRQGVLHMLNRALWQSKIALMMVLSVASSAVTPLLLSNPAGAESISNTKAPLSAQLIAQNYGQIPAGTRIPVRYDKAEKIVLSPDETLPITLTVSRNIKASNGSVLVPAGSRIQGRLQPTENGTQFVGDTLILANGRRIPIDASSQVVTKQQEIRKETDTGSILKGAAIGGGASALIRGITGNGFGVGTTLLGGAAGALGGYLLGKKSVRVTVIRPQSDLRVTLASPLSIAQRY